MLYSYQLYNIFQDWGKSKKQLSEWFNSFEIWKGAFKAVEGELLLYPQMRFEIYWSWPGHKSRND